jgi:hypothetical protein
MKQDSKLRKWQKPVLISFSIILVAITLIATRKPGIDFRTFYAVASLQAQHIDIYSQSLQRAVVSVDKGGEVLYYFHPPQELLIFRPLLRLRIELAFIVWCLLGASLIVGSAFLLRRLYPDFPIAAALALPFPMALIMTGQDSAIILAASALAFWCFIRKQDFAAGLILSIALIKPQFAVPLVAVLAFRYWRVATGFAIGAVVFLAESIAMVGIHGLREMFALGKLGDYYEPINQNTNLRGIVYLISGDHATIVVGVSLLLVVVAAFVSTDRDRAFSLAVVVCQLVTYHGHTCDLLPLLIPIAVLWRDARMFWITIAFTVLFFAATLFHPAPFQILAVPLVALLWVALRLSDYRSRVALTYL